MWPLNGHGARRKEDVLSLSENDNSGQTRPSTCSCDINPKSPYNDDEDRFFISSRSLPSLVGKQSYLRKAVFHRIIE